MNLLQELRACLLRALETMLPEGDPAELEMLSGQIRAAQDARFGDYQINAAMPLGKSLGAPPRKVAEQLAALLDVSAFCHAPEIAGPGFLNLKLRDDFLARRLTALIGDERLGVPAAGPARCYVIDFSSPNVAKPMHVGHLRSTIIGDCLARLLRFLGHRVVTDNHLGDWGTQFGMLIYGFKNFLDPAALEVDPVREMVRLYIAVREKIKQAGGGENEEEAANPVAEACRRETAKLHAGDGENVLLWQRMMPWCQAELDRIYERLDVKFDYTYGESFYNPLLAGTVADLERLGLAEESHGAKVIFFAGEETPALVQKSDGAFTYTTTDLATVKYRVEQFQPDAILYVVDFRQSLHFQHLFDAVRRWKIGDVELHHVSFGSVLGADKRPIKTREGGAVELDALLNEGEAHALRVVSENSPELSDNEKRHVAQVVGMGAVKYADLSQNRTSDYVFSWEKMLATVGNTATYMQYAYARVCGIFRKAQVDPAALRAAPPAIQLCHGAERALALNLLRLPESLQSAATELKPNLITQYLWDLANSYSGFFENCPVIKAETDEQRASRLAMCDLTARTLRLALDLLGIRVVEKM